jgi:diphosphomevalonate decarboxylase
MAAHLPGKGRVSAVAHPNIALVKYWGKRSSDLNLPAVGSLSITLDTLRTQTDVCFVDAGEDTFYLNGAAADAPQAARLTRFVDRLRHLAGTGQRVEVRSDNNFPTGAGLASSASGFAALALACAHALGLDLDARALSVLARQGSGSAARSVFGGFARLHRGVSEDGEDCFAEGMLAATDWPLAVAVAVVSREKKAVGSTAGMESTRLTSPYYSAWCEGSDTDLRAAEAAIAARDFLKLGEVSEHSCLKMHAVMWAAEPPLMYWHPATLALMQAVRCLRATGVPVFFTIDAGPQLKAVCLPDALPQVVQVLRDVQGVQEVFSCGLGEGARLQAVAR